MISLESPDQGENHRGTNMIGIVLNGNWIGFVLLTWQLSRTAFRLSVQYRLCLTWLGQWSPAVTYKCTYLQLSDVPSLSYLATLLFIWLSDMAYPRTQYGSHILKCVSSSPDIFKPSYTRLLKTTFHSALSTLILPSQISNLHLSLWIPALS